ncbi:hypothetical protein [Deinococcus ficus]|uniref:Uncharacterized protein n=1 Tax=Deinococcus ficus TaxID=317577 RepID=A0A221T2W7_9DEIO|nr:hypothetical protein [Deinococcus ficus]ASN83267.1 hypothetical protein DFI_18895 [Deinococcus ficus]
MEHKEKKKYENKYFSTVTDGNFTTTKLYSAYYLLCIVIALLPLLVTDLSSKEEKIAAVLAVIVGLSSTFLARPVMDRLKADGNYRIGNVLHHLVAEAVASKTELVSVLGTMVLTVNDQVWDTESAKLTTLILATVSFQVLRIAYARYMLQHEYRALKARTAAQSTPLEYSPPFPLEILGDTPPPVEAPVRRPRSRRGPRRRLI